MTSAFGSSRREAHDATAFYERFVPPELSSDEHVAPPAVRDRLFRHDARSMSELTDNSVALVVTSPPYFAGKAYEQSLGENGVPGSYFEYLELLAAVFAECKRVLEPGGRIAVNVANLGRRPFRSLAGDVTEILSDLGLLLRGEVVWWKGRAAGGSCAWGTFQRPSNPVLRDVTERIVVASKGRFERALSPKVRERRDLPSESTITRDEFLEATTDLWEIPPESATRVGHPAPFPVALPARLIQLYTYAGDLVLDPFVGSGSTAVAALRAGRSYVGYDTDAHYLASAKRRIAEETERLRAAPRHPLFPAAPPTNGDARADGRFAAALGEGRRAKEVAAALLESCGFEGIAERVRLPGLGVELDFLAADRRGGSWAFELSGGFTTADGGLRRADALWRALGKAAVVHAGRPDVRLVLLTTEAPERNSSAAQALGALQGSGRPVFDVVELLSPGGRDRLAAYAEGRRER